MTPKRMLAGFFLRLVVLYCVLMVVWPLVKAPYAMWYRTLGSACFSRFGSGGSARLETWPDEEAIKDTVVRIENKTVADAKISLQMPISSRYTGYMPTAVVLCLVLATPLPWRRRFAALIVGILLVHLFIVAWLGVSILDEISNPLPPIPTHGFILPPAVKAVVKFLVENVVESVIACAYVVPIFIWIVAVFRKGDRDTLLRPFVRTEEIPRPVQGAASQAPVGEPQEQRPDQAG